MAIKKYVLTIEFDDNGDSCEYVEEKLVTESPDDSEQIIYELNLEDYFSKSDISCLLSSKIGKA